MFVQTHAPFTSSQDFVRALKAASDPPVPGGSLKIQIAQEAWKNTSFYVPSKAEVIAEWVLTKLVKDKGKDLSSNPIFDSRYWELVTSLLSTQDATVRSVESRSLNTWLTPLLHRLPLGSVLVSYLSSLHEVDEVHRSTLSKLVSASLVTMWPIAVQRMPTENLQECFGALLSSLSTVSSNNGIATIGRTVSTSYRNSLANSSNKKKLYQSFLQSYLKHWIRSLALIGAQDEKALKNAVLEAGVETLFNLDILRLSHDSQVENLLIEQLRGLVETERGVVLGIIPDIFEYYISSIKRNRGALFSQGSQSKPGAALEEYHGAGLRFFIALFSLVGNVHQDQQAWKTRLALLDAIDRENLFDRTQIETQMTFNEVLKLVIVALDDAWQDHRIEYTAIAVQCLSTIARIDYDLINPFASRILPLFLQIPSPSEEYFAFLHIVINYHTKTRTMGTFVQDLFSSLSSNTSYPKGPRERYQLFLSSPIMHTLYLGRLSKALHIFLTESQCLTTLNLVLDLVKTTWESFRNDAPRKDDEPAEGPRKKRKTVANVENRSEFLAVTYSLICRLASVVLSSLPVPSISADTLEEVQQKLNNFKSTFLHHSIVKSLKTVKKQGDEDAWSTEVVITANHCLLYALNVSRNPSLPPLHDDKMDKKMVESTLNEDILPQLVLEIYRNLLYNLSIGNALDHEEIIGRLTQYLSNHFTPADVQWSGQGHHLTKGEPGRAESSLALLHMVIERWLPVFDRLASPEQIEKLLKIITSVNLIPSSNSRQQMKPEDLLLGLLHSAQFWEFRNIRSVFSNLLDKKTAFLDSSSPKKSKSTSLLDKVLIYRYLLLFPMEYFTSQLLNDLIKRALVADFAISRLQSNDSKIIDALTVLRVFLKRAYVYCGTVTQNPNQESSQYLLHLLEPVSVDAHLSTDFIKATLDLVEIYFSKMLKALKSNGSQSVLEVLVTFTPEIFNTPSAVRSSSFISIVNLLEREFPSNGVPEEILAALANIYAQLSSTLIPGISGINDEDISSKELKTYADLVSGWYSLLCLKGWLAASGHTLQAEPLIGEKIMKSLVKYIKREKHDQSHELDSLCSNAFAVLLQELGSRPTAEHAEHLDVILATYISFCDVFSATSPKSMDLDLARRCRRMEITDYVYTLSLISDSLSSDIELLSPSYLLHLVHLASISLHDHPTHSLVHVQKFTTRCINIFNESSVFIQGPMELRLQVLELISQHCSDQQAALRSMDATGIWLFLFKHLAPSQEHDMETESAIFHKIVTILSSLIRLRRDLVGHALPHLGMILRQLILCIRACRSHLGAKQTALVMGTQPRWISAAHPLGGEEAKMLGRLLESLNAKTTVRFLASSSSASAEPQKAESLAKPFSKHAAYVLEAYIEAMNDPLCVLSLEVRKELQPGLFALCGMVSEHSRDSLMISALDAGGKATLKALWKDYEKQRYVGKG